MSARQVYLWSEGKVLAVIGLRYRLGEEAIRGGTYRDTGQGRPIRVSRPFPGHLTKRNEVLAPIDPRHRRDQSDYSQLHLSGSTGLSEPFTAASSSPFPGHPTRTKVV